VSSNLSHHPYQRLTCATAYTEFAYSGLSAARVGNHTECSLHAVSNGQVQQGGPADIYHDLMTITASVTNIGDVAGAEVAQLYLQLPEAAKAPFKQLRGFTKVFLEPGEAKSIEFVLQRRDLSVWDVDEQAWRMHGGTYTAYLSKSSRNVQDEISFELKTH
jgi:beta-glucosidase